MLKDMADSKRINDHVQGTAAEVSYFDCNMDELMAVCRSPIGHIKDVLAQHTGFFPSSSAQTPEVSRTSQFS
jgi:hypothetical protein